MNNVVLSEKVNDALLKNRPVLALESSILSQGMPYPESYDFAKKAESLCKKSKVTPATIAILDGVVHVGLSEKQLEFVCSDKSMKKVSRREISLAITKKWNCSTTVSSTLHIAHNCGIKVFLPEVSGECTETKPYLLMFLKILNHYLKHLLS